MSDELLERWRDGELTPEDDAAWGTWLRDADRLRRAVDAARVDAVLTSAVHARVAAERSHPGDVAVGESSRLAGQLPRAAQDRSRDAGESSHIAGVAAGTSMARAGDRRVRSRGRGKPSRVPFVVLALAAAAVLVVALVRLRSARLASPPTTAPPIVAETADLPTMTGDARQWRGSALLDDGSTPLAAGDRIVAAAGGATLAWRDGTRIALADGSAVALDAGPAKRLRLERGTIDADVAPQLAGRPLTIATPTATAEVVGTAFTLAAEDDGARLAVRHGRVRLHRVDGASCEVDAGHDAVVADGIGLAARTTTAPRRVDATPATCANLLPTLRAGDELVLAAGDYAGLIVADLAGEPGAWIAIRAATPGAARLHARPGVNTIEIARSHHVRLVDLDLDGAGVDGPFGISAKSDGGVVHHIAIERCSIHGYDSNQQMAAISTKIETWAWRICGNRIADCGVGLSLGNNVDPAPFVGGAIEGNVVTGTMSYCVQVMPSPPPRRAPASARRPTLIADNVFAKGDRPSPDGDRPSVILDGGSDPEAAFDVARNAFWGNPREALLQGSGALAIHDNLFVDSPYGAIVLSEHGGPLRSARIVDNTVLAASPAVRVSSPGEVVIVGNAFFVDAAIAGEARASANLVAGVDAAAAYLAQPSTTLGEADLHPLPGRCFGEAVPPADRASDIDFDGRARGDHERRGAYAGENAGAWRVSATVKPVLAGSP